MLHIMKAEKFAWWYRLVVKILIPVSFFVIASWPKSYWLAGVMTVLTVLLYVLQADKVGEKK